MKDIIMYLLLILFFAAFYLLISHFEKLFHSEFTTEDECCDTIDEEDKDNG